METQKIGRWTHDKATQHIVRVNRGKIPYGLTYLSACDFLHINPAAAKNMK